MNILVQGLGDWGVRFTSVVLFLLHFILTAVGRRANCLTGVFPAHELLPPVGTRSGRVGRHHAK